MTRELLHTRQIRTAVYDIGGGKLLLIGWLEDTRAKEFQPVEGTVSPAGVMHDLSLELEVSLPDFTITAARAVMTTVPREACREVLPSIAGLVGLRIVGGFTSKVKKLMGGPRGCAHFVNLALAMAPVAIQGAAAYLQQAPLASRAAVAGDHVVDSCYVWRADGPLAQRVRERLESES